MKVRKGGSIIFGLLNPCGGGGGGGGYGGSQGFPTPPPPGPIGVPSSERPCAIPVKPISQSKKGMQGEKTCCPFS